MKRKSLLFLLLFALLAPWTANAQQTETFTVYENETGTNSNIPIYGLWADANQHSEFIIPAADLADIACGTISKLTFHISSKASKIWNGTAQIYLKEVSETTFATPYAYYGTEGATIVYEGGLDAYTSFEMAVPFTENVTYTYGGGNLLVGLIWTTGGNYGGASFYGKSATGASISHYGSNSPSAKNFIPRVTFTYTPSPYTPPATIAYTNNAPGNTTVSWTAPNTTETVTGYKYRYKKTAVTDWDGWYTLGASTTSGNLAGLDYSTEYEFEVKAVYGENESCASKKVIFTTLSDCMTPENLTITNVTTNSATFNWTEGFGQGSWTFGYKKTTEAEYTTMAVAAADLPLTLEVFEENTAYDVKVYPVCDETKFITDQFITKCEPITEPSWEENFESYNATTSSYYSGHSYDLTASCWKNEHISGAGTYLFQISSYSSTTGNTTKKLVLPDMTSGTMTKLVLPGFEIPSGTNYQFSLDVYRNSSTSNYGEGIRVFASTDGEIEGATELAFISRSYATAYTIGGNIIIPAESASGWYSYELPIGFDGVCYIILRGESLFGSSTFMDNFAIEPVPTCHRPRNLAYTPASLTNHSVTLTWIPGSEDQSEWQIVYNNRNFDPNVAGFEPNPDSTITVTDTCYTFNKTLQPSTTYYAYVRANCGDGDLSKWSKVVKFTTKVAAPAPTNFQKKDVGPDYAKLTWKAGGGDFETAWELYYVASETAPTAPADTTIAMVTVTTLPTDENPYVLEGLANETRYYIWVRADHGTDGKSAWTALSGSYFTTLVACPTPTNLTATNVTPSTATLNWAGYSESYNVHYRTSAYEDAPFMQNFEISLGNWTFTSMNAVNGMGGTGSYPAGIVADAAHNGSYGFRFSSYTRMSDGETYDQYLVSPEMTVTGSLKFYAWTHGAADSLYLGVSTTTNNLDAFTWEKLTFASTYTWLEFTKELSSNVKYIAFHYFGNFAYYCYVDDISIGEIVEIPAGEWLDANSPVAGTTTNIQGLSDGTKYEWQVQPTCAVDPENPENGWTASAYFTTPDACTAPFALDTVAVASNSAILKWTGYQESYNVRYRTAETVDILLQTGMYTSNYSFTGWTESNAGEESGLYYLNSAYTVIGYVFVDDETVTGSQYFISPQMEPTDNATLEFFGGSFETTEYLNIGFSSTDNDVASFTWYSEEPMTIATQDYFEFEVPDGTKYIAFQYTPGEAEEPALFVTDITVYALTPASEWEYAYNVTSPATIDGLNAETWYEWQVQGNLEGCGENDATDWTASKYFQTHKKTTVTQTMELAEGWNWWSTYIEAEDVLAQLKASLGTNGMQISTTGGGLTYRNGKWIGTISSIDNAKGYKIRTNAPVTVTIEGSIVNPDSCLITINEGWNWIGYPLTESQAVGTALAGFPASNGDNIKTQGGGANYRNGRWLPATFTLEPGKSYAYKSNSSEVKTLIFSNSRKAESTPKTNVKPASSVIRIEGLKEVKIENLKKFK